jgi:uncharacterized membrane protein YoaT (DUF817 family)
VKTFLIVATVVWGSTGLLSISPVMMSPMMFDAPGSYENRTLRRLVASLVSFPVTCAIAITAAWMLHAWVDPTAAVAATALPLLSILVFAYYVAKFTRETKQAKAASSTNNEDT